MKSLSTEDLRSDLQQEFMVRGHWATNRPDRGWSAFNQPSLGQPESHNSKGRFSTNSLNEQCCRPIYAFISIQSPFFYMPTTVRLLEYWYTPVSSTKFYTYRRVTGRKSIPKSSIREVGWKEEPGRTNKCWVEHMSVRNRESGARNV